jgi:hypothetical protein
VTALRLHYNRHQDTLSPIPCTIWPPPETLGDVDAKLGKAYAGADFSKLPIGAVAEMQADGACRKRTPQNGALEAMRRVQSRELRIPIGNSSGFRVPETFLAGEAAL